MYFLNVQASNESREFINAEIKDGASWLPEIESHCKIISHYETTPNSFHSGIIFRIRKRWMIDPGSLLSIAERLRKCIAIFSRTAIVRTKNLLAPVSWITIPFHASLLHDRAGSGALKIPATIPFFTTNPDVPELHAETRAWTKCCM
jgi:hypothetical protein